MKTLRKLEFFFLMQPRYHGSRLRMEVQNVMPCSQGLSVGKSQGSIDSKCENIETLWLFLPLMEILLHNALLSQGLGDCFR